MVDFIIANPECVKGIQRTSESRAKVNGLFNNLATILNEMGPPIRGGEGWRKVFYDYKIHIRNKLRRNRIFYQHPQGWPKKLLPLTCVEKKVASFLNLSKSNTTTRSCALNLPSVRVNFKRRSISRQNAKRYLDRQNEPLDGRYSPPVSRKYKKAILKAQIEDQVDYADDTLALLNEINNSLQCLVDFSTKNLELEQTRLELERKKFNFKKNIETESQNAELEKLQLQRDLLRLRKETAGLVD